MAISDVAIAMFFVAIVGPFVRVAGPFDDMARPFLDVVRSSVGVPDQTLASSMLELGVAVQKHRVALHVDAMRTLFVGMRILTHAHSPSARPGQ